MTKETFIALQGESERLEFSIASGEETPNTDARVAEIDALMEQSPWRMDCDEGVVLKDAAADRSSNSPG